jgi:hypothetical protein
MKKLLIDEFIGRRTATLRCATIVRDLQFVWAGPTAWSTRDDSKPEKGWSHRNRAVEELAGLNRLAAHRALQGKWAQACSFLAFARLSKLGASSEGKLAQS